MINTNKVTFVGYSILTMDRTHTPGQRMVGMVRARVPTKNGVTSEHCVRQIRVFMKIKSINKVTLSWSGSSNQHHTTN